MLRLFLLTLCAPLLLLSASCGTTPSTTPSIERIVEIARCPKVPSEFERVIPPPTFEEEDSWGTLALKYRDWGLGYWKRAMQAAKWRGDHPEC